MPWMYLMKVTCQFEHDDDERDGHPCDTAKDCSGADHCVQPWSDAGVTLIALALKVDQSDGIRINMN